MSSPPGTAGAAQAKTRFYPGGRNEVKKGIAPKLRIRCHGPRPVARPAVPSDPDAAPSKPRRSRLEGRDSPRCDVVRSLLAVPNSRERAKTDHDLKPLIQSHLSC